jgi:hypothetical protein
MRKQDRFLKVQLDGRGQVYLQVLDKASRWGFYLTDGKSVWEGSFGMRPHHTIQVTRRRCPRLDWVANMIANGIATPSFGTYELLYCGYSYEEFRSR